MKTKLSILVLVFTTIISGVLAAPISPEAGKKYYIKNATGFYLRANDDFSRLIVDNLVASSEKYHFTFEALTGDDAGYYHISVTVGGVTKYSANDGGWMNTLFSPPNGESPVFLTVEGERYKIGYKVKGGPIWKIDAAAALENMYTDASAYDTNDSRYWILEEVPSAFALEFVAVSPLNNATRVSRTNDLAVSFSKNIALIGTPVATITNTSTSATVSNVAVSVSNNVLNITHDAFDYNTTYAVALPANSVKDVEDDAPYTSAVTWQFTTLPQSVLPISSADTGAGAVWYIIKWWTSDANDYRAWALNESNGTLGIDWGGIDPNNDRQLFCFIGDNTNGYEIYNKAALSGRNVGGATLTHDPKFQNLGTLSSDPPPLGGFIETSPVSGSDLIDTWFISIGQGQGVDGGTATPEQIAIHNDRYAWNRTGGSQAEVRGMNAANYLWTSAYSALLQQVTVVIDPNAKYAITVTGGTADLAEASYGATVHLTANAAPDGKKFGYWESSDGISFANANSATTTFTMPAKAVTVTAVFVDKSGDGSTPDDPFVIRTPEELASISSGGRENKYHVLGNDIDLTEWIANNADADIQTHGWKSPDVFRKTLDGQGYTISGLWSDREYDTGLIYQLHAQGHDTDSCIIKNMTIEIDNSKGGLKGKAFAGGLAAKVNQENNTGVLIYNVHVKGNITSENAIGGLVGRADAPLTILDCSMEGDITLQGEWKAMAGGLVGQKYEGWAPITMKNCTFSGNIKKGNGASDRAGEMGGLIGTCGPNALIDNCYAEGSITTNAERIGGLIGFWGHNANGGNMRYASEITNSHANMTLVGGGNVGGLIGEARLNDGDLNASATPNARALLINNCYAEGEITTDNTVGGCIGSIGGTVVGANIKDCYSTATIHNTWGRAAGLIGFVEVTDITIEDCYYNGVIDGITPDNPTGNFLSGAGLIGAFKTGDRESVGVIRNCYTSGQVARGSGLITELEAKNILIDNCRSDMRLGSDNADSNEAPAGLIGSASKTFTLKNSYFTGDATPGSGDYCGGLIGFITGGDGSLIDSCYATTTMKTSWGVSGGLVGRSDGATNLTIQNSWADANITNGNYGGIIGWVGSGSSDVATIKNCYSKGLFTSQGFEYGGGLVGKANCATTIQTSYSRAKMFANEWADGEINIGGLVGKAVYPTTIQQCYFGGDTIKSGKMIGGLIGRIEDGAAGSSISESYALGYIDNPRTGVSATAGGLVGKVWESSSLTITNSFALNSAVIAEITGVLVGEGAGNTTFTGVQALEALNTLTQQTGVSAFVSRKNAVEQATYTAKNWDFTDTWTWRNGNYVLPVLKGMAGQATEQPSYLVVLGDFVIEANETRTLAEYLSGGYSDIIIKSTDTQTGKLDLQGGLLPVDGVVKLQKTVAAEKWYPIGLPFNVETIYSHYLAEQNGEWNPLLPWKDTPYSTDYFGDYYLMKYVYDLTPFSFTTENMQAGKGYVIQFPAWYDATDISFISANTPTLTATSLAVSQEPGYQLVPNNSFAHLQVTQGDGDKYYYQYNSTNKTFEKPASGASITIAPFEAVITVSTSNPSILKSSFAINETVGIILPPAGIDDPVVSVKYFNLQGQEVISPADNNVYIVKKTLKSGKTNTIKELRIKN